MAQNMLSVPSRLYHHDPAWRQQLKKPRNIGQRLVYALAAAAAVNNTQMSFSLSRERVLMAGTSPATRTQGERKATWVAQAWPGRHSFPPRRAKRHNTAPPPVRNIDWKFMLAAYVNEYMGLETFSENIDDRQLAAAILMATAKKPELLAHVARLSLLGSGYYGERLGEGLSREQQRTLVGQTLCKLLFKEDNIALRVATIFARHRRCTIQELRMALHNASAETTDPILMKIWQHHYEAHEMPTLYLADIHKLATNMTNTRATITTLTDSDHILVGSISWALIHFGARALILSGDPDFSSETPTTLLDIGLGMVTLLENNQILRGSESVFHLGLLIFLLDQKPLLSFEEALSDAAFTEAKSLFLAEILKRQSKAKTLYHNVASLRKQYTSLPWQSRKAAAIDLLDRYCGGHKKIKKKYIGILFIRLSMYFDPVEEYLDSPDRYHCSHDINTLPNLNLYYNETINYLSERILSVDKSLLDIVFSASDARDDTLQIEQLNFLNRASLQWVMPKLVRKRKTQEMFYWNKTEKYLAKKDVTFFLAKDHNVTCLVALSMDNKGYRLYFIDLHDDLSTVLRPLMENWPARYLATHFELALTQLKQPAIHKAAGEPVENLYRRFAEIHFKYYQQRLYSLGSEAEENTLWKIADDITGLLVPFYGCMSSVLDHDINSAAIECMIDGSLVGIPLFFSGIEHGLAIYQAAKLGIGRTLENRLMVAGATTTTRKIIPISTQIAGGARAVSDEMLRLTHYFPSEVAKVLDPGLETLNSVYTLTKGIAMALSGRILLNASPLLHSLLSISQESHKVFTTRTSRFFPTQYGYGEDGVTPVTAEFDGECFTIFNVRRGIIATENGEFTPQGRAIFVKINPENHFGMDRKYVYALPVTEKQSLRLEEHQVASNDTLSLAAIEKYNDTVIWRISSRMPITVLVVYPQHSVKVADTQHIFFEANYQSWLLDPIENILSSVHHLDYWEIGPRDPSRSIPVISLADNERDLHIKIDHIKMTLQRLTDEAELLKDSRSLKSYALTEDHCHGSISLYQQSLLSVPINHICYLMKPEQNRPTFLIVHSVNKHSAYIRASYDMYHKAFIFASPQKLLSSKVLSARTAHYLLTSTTRERFFFDEFLLPSLFNGALIYANLMLLKIADRTVIINELDDYFYEVSQPDENSPAKILRYELFTKTFNIIPHADLIDNFQNGITLSPFEALAESVFNVSAYPNLSELCLKNIENSEANTGPLLLRLKQVNLLLRLDSARRRELLHSTLSSLRAFKTVTQGTLGQYPVLALWTAFETLTARLSSSAENQTASWRFEKYAQLANLSQSFRWPSMLAAGHHMRLFLYDRSHMEPSFRQTHYREITLIGDTLLLTEGSQIADRYQWIAPYSSTQSIQVNRHTLYHDTQPSFWLNDSNDVSAKTVGGHIIPLLPTTQRNEIKNILTSPKGSKIVIVSSKDTELLLIEFYRLPIREIVDKPTSLKPVNEILIAANHNDYKLWWLTEDSKLYIISENAWHIYDQYKEYFPTPEGYAPRFISPDQIYLGYTALDPAGEQAVLILYDIIQRKQIAIHRSQPERPGMDEGITCVAFSPVNAMVAIAFADGYIEIYALPVMPDNETAVSLGGLFMPLAYYRINGQHYVKPKNIAMKFNNAFDRLIIFYDEGIFSTDTLVSGTFSIAEIRPDMAI
ncbi:hypothetical protein [Martelella alba]|uniref:Uncharacterized protein n=1 Tax=Martelella alba TaxID=2590451 RepID=A0ABY2SGD1_9HYPH|nr:hypothetical protein [Martelella alba]TKI03246.1 hypothetical protein FCN80_22165 [Martelella alba]